MLYVLIRFFFFLRGRPILYPLLGGGGGMVLKWGVRPSDTQKLEPFWGHKGHFLDLFWTHFIARYAIFPNKKCPKWSFFDPFWPPFRPSGAVKITFLAFFRDILVSFIECYQNIFTFFSFFMIFWVFRPFFQYFRFLGYFRRLARSNLQGPYRICRPIPYVGHISGYRGVVG